MAVANSNAGSSKLLTHCTCYKVASLTKTILDSKQISNIKQRYIFGEQLGWGQFGIIRECSDKFTGELFACKSIAKDQLVTPQNLESVKLEIEIMMMLSGHPNVVDLKAVYEQEDCVHLVMELCAGGELFDLLEKQGSFSESEARVLFKDLMQVVLYCHDNGVVHRDLKPENILLAKKNSSSPIKLADFGLATYIKPGQSLHGKVGSPFYVAPEVLAGGYDQAADVWSAGVILYILLSGAPPFWGKNKSQIFEVVRVADLQFPSNPWDQILESAKNLIRGMLHKDPSKRFTAQQVLDHPWFRVPLQPSEELCTQNHMTGGELHSGGTDFPTSLMARNQDISFSTGIPMTCDSESASFSCRSSSSFPVEPSMPHLEPSVFSFHSNRDSIGLEFSAPILSVPSFAFLSTHHEADQRNEPPVVRADMSRVDPIYRDSSMGKLPMLPGASLCVEARGIEPRGADFRRSGGTSGSRDFGVHNKRNHTIGPGELEQLDLIVTESVIRWASCTHLPTSPRSSLVC